MTLYKSLTARRWVNQLTGIIFLLSTCLPGRAAPGGLVLGITTQMPTCDNRVQPTSSSRLGDGSITVTVSGGTAPYTYSLKLLTGLQNNGYFPGLSQGNYDVVVTDALGETIEQNVYLANTLPQPLMGTDILKVPSSCTAADGSLMFTGYGGTPPYTFSIDGGISYHTGGTTLTNLQQGAYYTFLLKDANGCLAASRTSGANTGAHDMFICNFCCALQIQALVDNLPCGNDGQLSVYASNATPPVYYSLDGSNYQLGNGYNHYGHTFFNLGPGLYHIYARDANGLETQSAFTLAKACANTLDYVGTQAGCQQSDGTIRMLAAFGTGPYSYTIDGIHYQAGNVFGGLAAGTYHITAMDAMGTMGSCTAVVTANCPAVMATTTIQTCGHADASLTARGEQGVAPYLFSLDGINFQQGSSFNGLSSGNYTIWLKDGAGIVVSTPVMVYSANCLQVSAVAVNTICGKANGSLAVSGASGTPPYQYSKDGINYVSNNLFNGLTAGNYTVGVKDAGGYTSTQVVNVGDAPAPDMTVVSSPASCKNTAGSIELTAMGGTQPFLYSIDQGLHFQWNTVFNQLDSGKYQLVIKDANGCTVGKEFVLQALPTPALFLGNDTTLCDGQNLLLRVPAVADYQYKWQDNSNNNVFAVSQPGSYYVNVVNQYQCVAADTIRVQYQPLPVFNLGSDTSVCAGTDLLLQPALAGGNYLWSDGSQGASIAVRTAGLYWLQVNNGGCRFADSVVIRLKPVPVVNLGRDTMLCEGQSVLLNAQYNNASYRWQDGFAGPLYTVRAPGNYRVVVTANGCLASGQVLVTYTAVPRPMLGKDTTLCMTDKMVLHAGFPGSVYQWQDGSVQPDFQVSAAGRYGVVVQNGCGRGMDTINIQYKNCDCHFYVPSAFSANLDGRNDVFRPKYRCLFDQYSLKVFNRFGQLVFYTADPQTGWDGQFKGSAQPAGAYIWIIQYVDRLIGKVVQEKGSVVLMR